MIHGPYNIKLKEPCCEGEPNWLDIKRQDILFAESAHLFVTLRKGQHEIK
jgi:hypothetical protein